MAVVDIYNIQKEKVSEIDLDDSIFKAPINKQLIHQVVVSQTANQRAGTSSSKKRSEVSGSTKKLYRQKGTGRARAGVSASPTRRGGGVAFGPSPRNYVKKVSKKVRKSALRMALSDKVQTSQLYVVDSFSLSEIKTKTFVRIMKNFDVNKALIVTSDQSKNLEKSSRNLQTVKVMRYQGLNVYDILKYNHLFLEQSAIGKLQEALHS